MIICLSVCLSSLTSRSQIIRRFRIYTTCSHLTRNGTNYETVNIKKKTLTSQTLNARRLESSAQQATAEEM